MAKQKNTYVATSLGAVAKFFGKSESTVKQWRTAADPMPGKAGRYDLLDVAVWLLNRTERGGDPATPTTRSQLEEAKIAVVVRRQQLALEQAEGKLVAVEDVSRLFERSIAAHNTQAEQLRDRVELLLPEGIEPAERERIVEGIEKAVDDLRESLADAADEWARTAEGKTDDVQQRPNQGDSLRDKSRNRKRNRGANRRNPNPRKQ